MDRAGRDGTTNSHSTEVADMRRVSYLVCGLVIMLVVANPAYAYLDPGTGSMILQIILGGLAGVLIGWKFFWYRIKEFLGWDKKTGEG